MNLDYTMPDFLEDSQRLVTSLKKLSPGQLQKLMKINPGLAKLNAERYQQWSLPFSTQNAAPAILSFQGDVYRKLQASSFTEEDLMFAQEKLRILSGLYGILRPLDLIQAYRLEMSTGLKIGRKSSLYHYWGDRLTTTINSVLELQNENCLLNLASNEYFKALLPKQVSAKIISPVFKEFRNGKYAVFAMFSKEARGLIARFIIKNKIKDPEQLVHFDEEGYGYDANQSTKDKPVFTR